MIFQDRDVEKLFRYDPNTGNIYWNAITRTKSGRKNGRVVPGAVAGSINTNGYIKIVFSGRSYYAHRLAWFLHTGKWPAAQIDHINRIKTDNRIENLREATPGQNSRNAPSRKSSLSGIRGVYLDRRNNRYVPYISQSGKLVRLGSYKTAEEASVIRERAAAAEYKEFLCNA